MCLAICCRNSSFVIISGHDTSMTESPFSVASSDKILCAKAKIPSFPSHNSILHDCIQMSEISQVALERKISVARFLALLKRCNAGKNSKIFANFEGKKLEKIEVEKGCLKTNKIKLCNKLDELEREQNARITEICQTNHSKISQARKSETSNFKFRSFP